MTVKELIVWLQRLPQDMQVVEGWDSGWREEIIAVNIYVYEKEHQLVFANIRHDTERYSNMVDYLDKLGMRS